MKIFRSESLVDYKTYTFNYAVYCRQEQPQETTQIYRQGFLPYSNHLLLPPVYYYLARSLRVDLHDFKPTSENRRVAKKIAVLEPSLKVIEKKDFDKNEAFDKFCLDYATLRFDGAMSKERFNYIYNWDTFNKIFVFTGKNQEVLGYVFTVVTGEILHYWFSFYNLNHSRAGLGKWMMFTVIQWAKEQGLQEVYLGTCYGEKAMYKMRDFKGLRFFDGNSWNADMKRLKQKCKSDDHFQADDFKRSLG